MTTEEFLRDDGIGCGAEWAEKLATDSERANLCRLAPTLARPTAATLAAACKLGAIETDADVTREFWDEALPLKELAKRNSAEFVAGFISGALDFLAQSSESAHAA
jgi:hypothetical protein